MGEPSRHSRSRHISTPQQKLRTGVPISPHSFAKEESVSPTNREGRNEIAPEPRCFRSAYCGYDSKSSVFKRSPGHRAIRTFFRRVILFLCVGTFFDHFLDDSFVACVVAVGMCWIFNQSQPVGCVFDGDIFDIDAREKWNGPGQGVAWINKGRDSGWLALL